MSELVRIHCKPEKGITFMFNFGKCGPILVSFSLFHLELHCKGRWKKTYHLIISCCSALRNSNVQLYNVTAIIPNDAK